MNRTIKNKRRRNRKGGEALASGGFGCKTDIKCQNKNEEIAGASKV